MPRKTNTSRSVRITITTTQQVQDYLQNLVTLGIHGKTVPDVADRLICERLANDLRRRRAELFKPPQPEKEAAR